MPDEPAGCGADGSRARSDAAPDDEGCTRRTGAARADAAFAAMDANRDGALSRDEFRQGWMQLRRMGAAQAGLRSHFQQVDANRDQAIDASEYGNLKLVRDRGPSAPPLSRFDTNKNQRLEFGEYLGLVRELGGVRTAKPGAPAKAPSR